MDTFKQKRNLIVTIVILVVINLITLLLLWFGKPKYNISAEPEAKVGKKVHIQKLLKEELGFSDAQAEQYITLRNEHHKNTMQLTKEIKRIKREMFEQVLTSDDTGIISDSLLNLSLGKQKQLENLTFQHFRKLKKICNPDQRKKLMRLMHKLLSTRQHERMGDMPPKGKLPPIRN